MIGMQLIYYPGCTVKSYAKDYENIALKVLEKLGAKIIEMPDWTCCGVVPGLVEDVPVQIISPIRNLSRAQEFAKKVGDGGMLFSLCSMCYNSLKSADIKIKNNSVLRERLNRFLTDEAPYEGEIKITHVLEILHKVIGTEKIKSMVKTPLRGIKIGAFYGCLLLRPREVALDDSEDPSIMEELVMSIGAEPVDYPYRTECCGSYNVVRVPNVTKEVSSRIIQSAKKHGADILVTTCPLCYFNLEEASKSNGKGAPKLFYLAELMAVSLGLKEILPAEKRRMLEGLLRERV